MTNRHHNSKRHSALQKCAGKDIILDIFYVIYLPRRWGATVPIDYCLEDMSEQSLASIYYTISNKTIIVGILHQYL
jgi:hypothetical protein